MAYTLKERPSEDEMRSIIAESVAKQKNSNLGKAFKPPTNLAEVRAQTPAFMLGIISHGSEQSRKRAHNAKYYESAEDMQVEVERFFSLCAETNSPPNVGLLAAWFGVTRESLHAWETDEGNPCSDTVKKAKSIILSWNTYMAQTNQISAIMAMFSQKTEHGIVETQYLNITAQPGQGSRPENVTDEDFTRMALEAAKQVK